MLGNSVSVIIPVYNFTAFLEGAIHSALSQNSRILEIIVVNDGSYAEASARISVLCAADERIRLINQSNTGPAQARFNGVKHARGDYILFLDADDFLLDEAVSCLLAALEANPSAIAAYGRKKIVKTDHTGKILEDYMLPALEEAASGDILPALLLAAPLLSNGNVCIRREFVERISFPRDIRQGEDWVTWCRLALLGDIVYAGDAPVVCIRLHPRNTSGRVRPSELFGALKVVFRDGCFMKRIGERKLAEYYTRHQRHLLMYFHVSSRNRNQHIRARHYKLLWRVWNLRCRWREMRARSGEPGALSAGVAPKGSRIRIVHIVKWFYAGGAERLITTLLKHSDKERYEHIVLSLSDQDERIREIRYTLDIPFKAVEIRRNGNNLFNYMKCLLFLNRANPDIIKTWLPPSNISGGILGKTLRIPVIWGIHDAQVPKTQDAKRQIPLSRLVPEKIVCCSRSVYERCRTLGYNENLLETITNGADTDLFSYSPKGRDAMRRELNIPRDVLLIGMAAEFVPLKRHNHFLAAAKIFLASYPRAQFLFCGKGASPDNIILRKYIQVLDMEQHIHLLGIRNDMADIYSALDIHTLNSTSESFGLAVAEAMACETLCVATDVGIMAELLDNVGCIIPVSESPHTLAEAWKKLVRMTEKEKFMRRKLGRNRIREHYSIAKAAEKYDALYASVFERKNAGQPAPKTACATY